MEGGTRRRFNRFADLQSSADFHICRDLTTKPKEERHLSSELGNLRGYQATTARESRANEMLNALNTTDKLDALYKRGRTSAEFISAATPIEGIFVNLHKKLTRGDPRSDLFANTFEAISRQLSQW